ncbi:hypothetical protein CSAL01_06410 [Colletotrichum salicis]|uniref:Uncharacterized protein n=1 Tax=Colletotrichum salicis TaxID=1209931 RepID=A0A135UH85_9PEZI|nr:hypothetical protein CSAL01_06410 [Colletotrichum salicis]
MPNPDWFSLKDQSRSDSDVDVANCPPSTRHGRQSLASDVAVQSEDTPFLNSRIPSSGRPEWLGSARPSSTQRWHHSITSERPWQAGHPSSTQRRCRLDQLELIAYHCHNGHDVILVALSSGTARVSDPPQPRRQDVSNVTDITSQVQLRNLKPTLSPISITGFQRNTRYNIKQIRKRISSRRAYYRACFCVEV